MPPASSHHQIDRLNRFGRRRIVRLAVGLLPVAVLTVSLLHPRTPELRRYLRGLLPSDWTYFDIACQFGYLAHSVAFFSVTVYVTLVAGGRPRRAKQILAAILAMGLLTETLQLLIPNRDFDPNDLLCNAVAACLGSLAGRELAARLYGPRSLDGTPPPSEQPIKRAA